MIGMELSWCAWGADGIKGCGGSGLGLEGMRC